MIQRLLFDRIDLQGGRRAVSQAIEFSLLIDANEAESRLTGVDVAVPRAEIAVDASFGLCFPPARFVQVICLLEDLQLVHGPSSQTTLYRWAERCAPVIEFLFWEYVRNSSVATALEPLPFRGPIHKAFHVVAILPGKVKELARSQIGSFFSEERLKAPANVRTLPGVESVAASCIPVILHCLEHNSCAMGESPSPRGQDSSFRPPAPKDGRARSPSWRRASPISRCSVGPFQ